MDRASLEGRSPEATLKTVQLVPPFADMAAPPVPVATQISEPLRATALTRSEGRPLIVVKLAHEELPSKRLTPPRVAAHTVPAPSTATSATMLLPRPSPVV